MPLRDDEVYEDESGGNSDLAGRRMSAVISAEGKFLFETECKSIAVFTRRLRLCVKASA